MRGSGEVGKIVRLRARDSHHALYDGAFSLNTPSGECDIHAVRSPQPEDRDLGAGTTPVLVAGRYHLLAENSDFTSFDAFDGASDFADQFDAVRGQRAIGLA